jgi:Tol biopolymer transport system component
METVRLLRRALITLIGIVGCVSVAATLPRLADRLPRPLDTVARSPERVWTRAFAPRVGRSDRLTGLTASERDAVRTLARRLDGRIVWSSNRSGTHQLYLVDLHDQSARQLTGDDHVKFYARFSPDGTQLAYMRSERPWVSYRDETGWDLYVMRVDGSGARLLARQVYAPAWTPDGQAVLVSRGNRTLRVNVTTGEEAVLFDADQALPGGNVLGVSLSPDERSLAFTIRGFYDGVAVYDRAQRHLTRMATEQACQIAWRPDGEMLVWIEVGGHGGTRVMAGRPDGTGRHVFMDLPGAYAHQYFPSFSNDGRWFIWGAAAEGHEHDRADYEIFVWEVDTPWDQAIRLTYHPGNDNWPDLWVRPGT